MTTTITSIPKPRFTVQKDAPSIKLISWEEISHQAVINRWRKAAEVLQNLSHHERTKHWNMGTFGGVTSCGTTACAAGHCGMDPWFRRRGLRLNFVADWFDADGTILGYRRALRRAPDQEDPLAFDVDVSRFFGPGVGGIFYDGTERSVGDVIKQIKAWIQVLERDND